MGVIWNYVTNPIIVIFEIVMVGMLLADRSERMLMAVGALAVVVYVLLPLLLWIGQKSQKGQEVVDFIVRTIDAISHL